MHPKYTVWLDRNGGRLFYPVHRRMYQWSDGRLGHRSPMGPMLLLTTTGRRSGLPRTNPLLYMPDGDGFWVVGSNGGRPQFPAWLYNLRGLGQARVQAGRRKVKVRASILEGEQRAAVWPRLTEYYPGWGYYQQLTDRELPAVHLVPQ